jgi:hypothetical protein
VDWIRLAQDKDWWRAVVNVVMNLRVLALRVGWSVGRSVSQSVRDHYMLVIFLGNLNQ